MLQNFLIIVTLFSFSNFSVIFYVGLMNRDYETNAAHVHPSVINHWTGTGLAMSIAANRVSYIFNFTGPSLSIDCACSSSLVALHLACQSIKQGMCGEHVCLLALILRRATYYTPLYYCNFYYKPS